MTEKGRALYSQLSRQMFAIGNWLYVTAIVVMPFGWDKLQNKMVRYSMVADTLCGDDEQESQGEWSSLIAVQLYIINGTEILCMIWFLGHLKSGKICYPWIHYSMTKVPTNPPPHTHTSLMIFSSSPNCQCISRPPLIHSG